jgi:hypothetical protein
MWDGGGSADAGETLEGSELGRPCPRGQDESEALSLTPPWKASLCGWGAMPGP